MRSKALLSLGLVSAGVLFVSASAGAQACDEIVLPNAVRTYCYTDPLLKRTDAFTIAPNTVVPVYTDDNSFSSLGTEPGLSGGNEVVWQVIGSLGQESFNNGSGEGYCGYLGIPPTPIANNFADGIQDCISVARFGVPSAKKAITGASLCWDGSNIGGVWKSIAVTICDLGQADPNTFGDNEPVLDSPAKDCIVDQLNFVGGAFANIHNVEVRKGDNTVGLVGGVSDIDFAAAFPIRQIKLSDAAVRYLNDRQGNNVSFILRCNEQHGNWNGRSGGRDNLLVIHDPDGIGFGLPGTLGLTVSREKVVNND